MHVLTGQGPQEEVTFYDHPYFGQLFLAGVLGSISYPHSLVPPNTGSNMQHFIEMLYFVPRIMMGILAVIDTFLIYKISEYYYSRKIAFISSTLFAVMPSTWFIRWILLDSIQITLILSSILFAVYTRTSKDKNSRPKLPLILLSGIFLGLAIFTKIPAFTMIPLVGFLVYIKNRNLDSKDLLGLWLIPVILIPIVWHDYSMSICLFNFLVAGILWQVHRESQPFLASIDSFFRNDPILVTLGIAGLAFAIIKKDFLLLLWSIPFIIFLFLIGYVSSYHLIPLLPVLCIASAKLIGDIINKLSKRNVLRTLLIYAIASSIGIFGLINTTILITTNANSSYFKSAAFVTQYLQNINHGSVHYNFNKITVIADPFFLWIPQYIFQLDFNYRMYYDNTPIKTQRALLIIDHGLMNAMLRNDDAAKQLKEIYHSPKTNILRIFSENGNKDNQISIYQYIK